MTAATPLVSSDEDAANEGKAKLSTIYVHDIQSKTVGLTREVALRQAELDDNKVTDEEVQLRQLEDNEAELDRNKADLPHEHEKARHRIQAA